MNTLTVRDETTAGQVLHEIALSFEQEYITVAELIAGRIAAEVQRYQNDAASYVKSLVSPTKMEQRLNHKTAPEIDVEKQVYVALEAYQNNGFFILIDDEQVEELNQKFLVDASTKVSFIKLTPLVGG